VLEFEVLPDIDYGEVEGYLNRWGHRYILMHPRSAMQIFISKGVPKDVVISELQGIINLLEGCDDHLFLKNMSSWFRSGSQ
jgi:hypothetical protein